MGRRYILIVGLLLLTGCPGYNNGAADEPPVEVVKGTPVEPDEPIPPLTADELNRFQREIVSQYQQIDRAYERLDEDYEEALREGVLELPEEIREQHVRLARRHENVAQMHEDRIQVMLDIPDVIQNDLELGEINSMLATRHRDISSERLLDDLPVQVFHLRQELLMAREQMMALHANGEDVIDDPVEEPGEDPDMPGAPRQPRN